ncbi:MAG: universal stress protein [Gordonia sp. (in: high G+C Gram-positive bacteria)]
MSTRLYVAYLATDGGADALALGVRLARSFGAALDIGMVLPPDKAGTLTGGNFDDVLTAKADAWLAAAKTMLPDDIEVATHIGFYESTAEGIIAEAQRTGAASIVVGGTGGGLVGALSLGSAVNDLVHSSPVPVAIAPRSLRRSKVAEITQVTCALGDREGSGFLLDTAIRAAARARVPLRIVSLIALEHLPHVNGRDTLEPAREHARESVQRAIFGLPADAQVTWDVVDGPTIEDAVNKVEWTDGDILLVGSSRLAEPRRLFLGSTAAKMLRVVAVPMAIVPREDAPGPTSSGQD